MESCENEDSPHLCASSVQASRFTRIFQDPTYLINALPEFRLEEIKRHVPDRRIGSLLKMGQAASFE